MLQRLLVISGNDRLLCNDPLQIVSRRAATRMALIVAGVASVIALALGAMVGKHLAKRSVAADQAASHAARDYTIIELGELNATLAQIEPRLTRLSTHVGELRNLQAQLKFPKESSASPSTTTGLHDDPGSGGPALPPRPCVNASVPAAPPEIEATRDSLTCIAETLSALEHETDVRSVTWSAFPGRPPVDGAAIGSPFGNRIDPFHRHLSFHSGVDLVAVKGTPILATAGGRVSFAGEKSGYGKVIEIDHGNGLVTRYGHASRLLVRAGDLVLPRQHVADVGSTGRSTGPHLHFEVLKNTAPIDPSPYLSLFSSIPRG